MRSPARPVLLLALGFCSFSTGASAQTASSGACASLAEQKLPNTTITTAQAVTSGTFTPTGSTNPLIDDHVISALALIVVGAYAAHSAGYLGRWWSNQPTVRRSPWLR